MTPTLPRRSFLGWTAALAGCALLTRPALAVPVRPAFVQMIDLGGPGASCWVEAGEPARRLASLADIIAYEYCMPMPKALLAAKRMLAEPPR
jgi:hypothetical protein